jgi:hypothetical protein
MRPLHKIVDLVSDVPLCTMSHICRIASHMYSWQLPSEHGGYLLTCFPQASVGA